MSKPKGFKRTALCSAVIALSYAQPVLSRGLLSFDTPYGVRATGQGFLTTKSEGSAYLDGLFPIGGDENRLVFVDGLFMQGRSRAQVSSLSLGLRQRRATRFGDALIGAYVGGDYLKTLKGRNAWVINPGLEILTVKQEARLNVYTPLGSRDKSWGNSMASEIPDDVIADSGLPGNDLVRAFGNNFLDTPVALLEEFPTGVEVEVGQKITHGAWLRAGAYYFSYKGAKHTEGLEANLDIPLQTQGAHLLFMDSYDDRRHNLFSVGIRFDVGDTGLNRQGILSRMTNPLRRHLASVQVGSAVPVRLGFKANGAPVLRNNVLFFSPNGTNQDYAAGNNICTAENPCLSFNNANIGAIEGNANYGADGDGNFYFLAKGTYSPNELITFNGGADGSSEVWGFDSNQFNHQATGNNRPIINGALFWGNNGAGANSSGTVRNLQITNDNIDVSEAQSGFLNGAEASSIAVGATGDISVNNSAITASRINDTDVGNTNNKAIGVFSHDGEVTVANSTITATAGGDAGNNTLNDAYGVRADNGNATVTNSTITATAGGDAGVYTLNDAYGVYADNGNATVTNSTITATAGTDAIGIAANSINLESSTISVTGAGIYDPLQLNGGQITVSGSSCYANGERVNCE